MFDQKDGFPFPVKIWMEGLSQPVHAWTITSANSYLVSIEIPYLRRNSQVLIMDGGGGNLKGYLTDVSMVSGPVPRIQAYIQTDKPAFEPVSEIPWLDHPGGFNSAADDVTPTAKELEQQGASVHGEIPLLFESGEPEAEMERGEETSSSDLLTGTEHLEGDALGALVDGVDETLQGVDEAGEEGTGEQKPELMAGVEIPDPHAEDAREAELEIGLIKLDTLVDDEPGPVVDEASVLVDEELEPQVDAEAEPQADAETEPLDEEELEPLTDEDLVPLVDEDLEELDPDASDEAEEYHEELKPGLNTLPPMLEDEPEGPRNRTWIALLIVCLLCMGVGGVLALYNFWGTEGEVKPVKDAGSEEGQSAKASTKRTGSTSNRTKPAKPATPSKGGALAGDGLKGITLEDADGEGTLVRVKCHAAPTFVVFKLDSPPRLLVDIANVTMGNASPWIDVGSKTLASVAASQTKTPERSGVRVALNLRRAVTSKVYTDGKDLLVRLTPLVPGDAKQAEPAAGAVASKPTKPEPTPGDSEPTRTSEEPTDAAKQATEVAEGTPTAGDSKRQQDSQSQKKPKKKSGARTVTVDRSGEFPTLIIPIKGSTRGARTYSHKKPMAVAINLPRARKAFSGRGVRLNEAGFRMVYYRKRRKGIHLRVFFTAPKVRFKLRFARGVVRVILTKEVR